MSQTIAHSSQNVVIENMIKVGRIMVQGSAELRLNIADKSTIIPKCEAAETVARAIKAEGLDVKISKQGKDLGIPHAQAEGESQGTKATKPNKGLREE